MLFCTAGTWVLLLTMFNLLQLFMVVLSSILTVLMENLFVYLFTKKQKKTNELLLIHFSRLMCEFQWGPMRIVYGTWTRTAPGTTALTAPWSPSAVGTATGATAAWMPSRWSRRGSRNAACSSSSGADCYPLLYMETKCCAWVCFGGHTNILSFHIIYINAYNYNWHIVFHGFNIYSCISKLQYVTDSIK